MNFAICELNCKAIEIGMNAVSRSECHGFLYDELSTVRLIICGVSLGILDGQFEWSLHGVQVLRGNSIINVARTANRLYRGDKLGEC